MTTKQQQQWTVKLRAKRLRDGFEPIIVNQDDLAIALFARVEDARFAAAAPVLLEAAEAGLRTLGDSLKGLTEWEADRLREKLRAAIDAAEGNVS